MREGVNCKFGLTKEQELEARRIRKKLFSESEREEVYKEIQKIYEQYDYSTTFYSYLNKTNPALYSACERAKLQFSIIDRKLIISM